MAPSNITNPKVSIIIPIFNLENHLHQCLESAVNQTLADIEILCVNDGSRDRSLEIIKDFEERDRRIVVIDQPNGGVASARNAGLNAAKGEYVRFLDGDDSLPLEACANLYRFARQENSDVLICGYEYIPREGERISVFKFPNASYHLNVPR